MVLKIDINRGTSKDESLSSLKKKTKQSKTKKILFGLFNTFSLIITSLWMFVITVYGIWNLGATKRYKCGELER